MPENTDGSDSTFTAPFSIACEKALTRGGTPLYKVYRYVPPQRVWFLSRFGLKTGIDFNNYGLKSGRVFGAGTFTKAYKHIFLLSM